VAIEHGEQLIRERDFPGRQGRIAFVYLAAHRHRAVARDELLSAIWPDDPGQYRGDHHQAAVPGQHRSRVDRVAAGSAARHSHARLAGAW